MAGSAAAASLMAIAVKAAGARGAPAFEVVFARSCVIAAASGALALARGDYPAASPRRALLLLRGASGFLAVSCTYTAMQMLPLAAAAVLGYRAPLLTALFAPVVLGEPTPRAVFAALPVAAAGVVLVARPPALFGGVAGDEEGGGEAAPLVARRRSRDVP
jgi:drug/metabolite transporter (DMT)-like permease